MGRRTLTQLLISITSSTVAHGGTFLVFFALMGSLAVWLSPPPSGVHSIELELSIDSEAAADSARESEADDDPHATVRIETTLVENARSAEQNRPISPLGEFRPPVEMETSDIDSLLLSELLVQDLPERASRNEQAKHDTETESTTKTPSRTATTASISSRRNTGVQTDTLPTKIPRLSPPPIYPGDALARRMEGSVDLRVRVDNDGTVARVSVYRSSGYEPFDRAAIEAVRQWRFQPARVAGIAVTKEVVIGVNFVIGR